MSPKAQQILLGTLVLVLAVSIVSNFAGNDVPILTSAGGAYAQIKVEDPILRLALLEKIRKQPYEGAVLNIFTGRAIEQPKRDDTEQARGPVGPVNVVPPPPPEVVFNYKFYGVVTDRKSGKSRAFFTDGENVFVVNEGELLQNKWRLLRIGANSADMEDVASGTRKTVPLEQPQGAG
jgi:hypothetical protein